MLFIIYIIYNIVYCVSKINIWNKFINQLYLYIIIIYYDVVDFTTIIRFTSDSELPLWIIAIHISSKYRLFVEAFIVTVNDFQSIINNMHYLIIHVYNCIILHIRCKIIIIIFIKVIKYITKLYYFDNKSRLFIFIKQYLINTRHNNFLPKRRYTKPWINYSKQRLERSNSYLFLFFMTVCHKLNVQN